MVKTKELDNFSRKQIMHELLLSVNSKGKPAHGVINDMAKKYGVSRKTTGRVWEQTKYQQQNQFPINVNSKKKGKKSRTRIPFDDTKFEGLEKEKKTSQTAVARTLGV